VSSASRSQSHSVLLINRRLHHKDRERQALVPTLQLSESLLFQIGAERDLERETNAGHCQEGHRDGGSYQPHDAVWDTRGVLAGGVRQIEKRSLTEVSKVAVKVLRE
jgi:hypothetical protein